MKNALDDVDLRRAFDSSLPATQSPIEGHRYVIGYDPGRRGDSLLVVLNATDLPFRVVHAECVPARNYHEELNAMVSVSRRYNHGRVPTDATPGTAGSALCEELRFRGVAAIPFFVSRESKRRVFEHLALLIDEGNLRIPIPSLFWDSVHDPLLALALACWQATVDQLRPTSVDLTGL